MSGHRKLTAGEERLVEIAFGDGIDHRKVRLRDGHGHHPFARIAFRLGNAAIVVKSTVYFSQHYCADFSAPGENRALFLHEMTHVWQYRALGTASFFIRYLTEFARVKGRAHAMYAFAAGDAPFHRASLEAQAEMVCGYDWEMGCGDGARAALLARNLAGSGVFGL